MRLPIFVVMLTLLPCLSRAEYRVFELTISNRATGQERVALSNLDPNQYRRYYPVSPDEVVRYTATWMCRGNTSGLINFCPKPDTKAKK